ncbi:hypothetical protein VaNZ11_005916 [Volvox africanus]|uniref:Uncharacterized protein n=1 Tax=Volvox africanus TaxID=51714 RepID=A0ABQ5RZS7_9CHLO|nr:hypothetical protein VaNZ11_005916 [Volvox africanus]
MIPQQLLILVKGLPGCGKSTIAEALASALQCPLVDKDDARDCFQPQIAQAPDIDWNALSYDVMFRIAERQLALGLSVVLDCPFARRQLYDQACQLACRVATLRGSLGRDPVMPPAALPGNTAAIIGLAAPEVNARLADREIAPAEEAAARGKTASPVAPMASEAAAEKAGEGDVKAASDAEVADADTDAREATIMAASTVGDRTTRRSDSGSTIKVVVVDVECEDEAVWRRRLEARGDCDRGTDREHKPCRWEELQGIIQRYGGSWTWSTDGSTALPYHIRICTASSNLGQCVRQVLNYLESHMLVRIRIEEGRAV